MSEHRLEDALRDSLRREDPPAGFAAKILAQTVEGSAPRVVPKRERAFPERFRLQRPLGLAMAAGVAALAMIPAVIVEQHRREEARGLQAKQDILTALAITREQFQQAKERVQRTTTGEQTGEHTGDQR